MLNAPPLSASLWLLPLALAASACSRDSQREHEYRVPIEVPTHTPESVIEIEPAANPVPVEARDQRGPLVHFFLKLDRARTGADGATARVTQIGDSHTASDSFTSRTRELMQRDFGDAGRGAVHPGVPWRHYYQEHVDYGQSGQWETWRTLYADSSGPWTFNGVRLESLEEGARFSRSSCPACSVGKTFSSLEVHYLEAPGAGSFHIEVDGERVATIDADADERRAAHWEISLSDAPHAAAFEAADAAPVSFYLTSTTTNSAGVIWDALGINGAQVQHYLRADPDFTQSTVATLAPDLLVIELGGNEVFDARYRDPAEGDTDDYRPLLEKLETYQAEVQTLVRRLRSGAPDASCMLLLPADMKLPEAPCDDWRFGYGPLETPVCMVPPPENLGGIINAQMAAASAEGCAVWKMREVMGGEGSMAVWQGMGLGSPDGIHLSSAGYRVLGEHLYADLRASFEAWRGGAPADMTSRPVFDDM